MIVIVIAVQMEKGDGGCHGMGFATYSLPLFLLVFLGIIVWVQNWHAGQMMELQLPPSFWFSFVVFYSVKQLHTHCSVRLLKP